MIKNKSPNHNYQLIQHGKRPPTTHGNFNTNIERNTNKARTIPNIITLKRNSEKYQQTLNINELKKLELDTMETNIKYQIKTAIEKICVLRKHRISKLIREIQEIMVRQMNRESGLFRTK